MVERAEDGTVRQPGASNLAGSSLTLDRAVRNLVTRQLVGFDEAVAMASVHPMQFMQKPWRTTSVQTREQNHLG